MIASRPTESEGWSFADIVCLFGTAPRCAVSKCFKSLTAESIFICYFSCDPIKLAVDDTASLGPFVSAGGKSASSSTPSLSTIQGNRRRIISLVGINPFYMSVKSPGNHICHDFAPRPYFAPPGLPIIS